MCILPFSGISMACGLLAQSKLPIFNCCHPVSTFHCHAVPESFAKLMPGHIGKYPENIAF